MKWKMKATKMKELPDNMNLKHILSLVIKINALSNTAYQTSRGDRRVFPTWNVQQRSGKMAYLHVHRVGMVDGQKRRYSQSRESAAHGHSPVITPWLLQLPGVSQYLGSSVFSELKKKIFLSKLKGQLLCLGQSLPQTAFLQYYCMFVLALHAVWGTLRYWLDHEGLF